MKFLPCRSTPPLSHEITATRGPVVRALMLAMISPLFPAHSLADQPARTVRQEMDEESQADLLVQRTIQRLALGDAFDAKLRQRTWVQGHEVVGIGHYEQSGGGTGRYSLEMTIHDGDQRHTNHQISDGKLAWIRTHLGPTVTLRRVDLGRIEEVYRELSRQGIFKTSPTRDANTIVDSSRRVPPSMRVGGLVEVVEQIAADYDLRLSKGFVDHRAVWILRGVINAKAMERMSDPTTGASWSELSPYEVRMAIAAVGNEQGFGVGLPNRIEFWGQPPHDVQPKNSVPMQLADPSSSLEDPTADSESTASSQPDAAPLSDKPRGKLISLLEIYSVRRIEPSPEERFRFEREDRDVTFFNDTKHYLQRMTHQHTRLELP
jgi:hypothetical protein